MKNKYRQSLIRTAGNWYCSVDEHVAVTGPPTNRSGARGSTRVGGSGHSADRTWSEIFYIFELNL